MNNSGQNEIPKRKMSKKTKMQITVCVTAIAFIAAAAGYTLFVSPLLEKEEWAYKEYEAQFGNLKNKVTESGAVEFGITTQVYDLDVTTGDDDDDDDDEEEDYLKVEEVYVSVGQRISEGDKIYKFSESSINDVRKALTYAKTEAQIALSEAQTDYNIGVLQAGLAYNETMLDTSLAQTTYDNTMAGLNTQMAAKMIEIEQLLSDIYKLQCDLTDEDYLERKSDILDAYEDAVDGINDASADFVTNQVSAFDTFQSAKNAYENFLEQFDETNEQIDDKIEEVYKIQEEIAYNQRLLEKELLLASQQLTSSNISGEIAETKYKSSLTSYGIALAKAQNELDDAAQKLSDFNEFVGDGTIYAAGSGLVTEVGYEEGDYLISAGTLVSFAAAEDMTVSVDVSQEDVVTMKVGDSVDIAFAAYEGEEWKGIVKSITTTATSRSSATISYPVVISILGDTSKLYGGMTADVTFVTEEKADVVYVMRKAIIKEDGRSYVYQKENNEYVLTPVTTGFTDGESIEITEGLSEGDVYYIASIVSKTVMDENESGVHKKTDDMQQDNGDAPKNIMDRNGMGGMPDMNFPGGGFGGGGPR